MREIQAKKVVIVGGGFGGLAVAQGLKEKKGLDVLLLDRRNHHLFQPLLYQVATGALNPSDIATPLRSVLASAAHVRVVMDEVQSIELESQVVIGQRDRYSYDYLVLACGSYHSYFSHPDWEDFAPGLKTLEQALEIRRRIFQNMEDAERESDLRKRARLLTYCVIGGGPTGVELAGALGEIIRFTIRGEFRLLRHEEVWIYLIEAGERILPSFPESLSRYATHELEKLSVNVRVRSPVTGMDDEGIEVGGERIESKSVFWAAGVKASSLNQKLGVPLDSAGRIRVSESLRVAPWNHVFCIGDQASFVDARSENQKPLPGLAPVALQQGRYVAEAIWAQLNGRSLAAFRYVDKGLMATIGRGRAIADIRGHHLRGFLAWCLWNFVHILFLIGFRNKVFVLLQWAWSYVKYRRGARLITEASWKQKR